MITPKEVEAILQEADPKKRDEMVEALSEADAKYIVKSYADFLRRWDSK